MKYAAVWLFLIGVATDYFLTFIGLRSGLTEMNPWVGTPFGLLMVFAAAGMIISMNWLIEHCKLNKYWWMPYFISGIQWLAVPWNLYMISAAH